MCCCMLSYTNTLRSNATSSEDDNNIGGAVKNVGNSRNVARINLNEGMVINPSHDDMLQQESRNNIELNDYSETANTRKTKTKGVSMEQDLRENHFNDEISYTMENEIKKRRKSNSKDIEKLTQNTKEESLSDKSAVHVNDIDNGKIIAVEHYGKDNDIQNRNAHNDYTELLHKITNKQLIQHNDVSEKRSKSNDEKDSSTLSKSHPIVRDISTNKHRITNISKRVQLPLKLTNDNPADKNGDTDSWEHTAGSKENNEGENIIRIKGKQVM